MPSLVSIPFQPLLLLNDYLLSTLRKLKTRTRAPGKEGGRFPLLLLLQSSLKNPLLSLMTQEKFKVLISIRENLKILLRIPSVVLNDLKAAISR